MPRSVKHALHGTKLLVARRVFYGAQEIRFGTPPLKIITTPSQDDLSRATRAVREIERSCGLSEIQWEEAIHILAEHLAHSREMDAQRLAIHASIKYAEKLETAMRISAEPPEWMTEYYRLLKGGYLKTPHCVLIDEERFVSIAPRSDKGGEHQDLIALAAWRLSRVLKSAGKKAKLHKGHEGTIFYVADALTELIERKIGEDWTTKRISACNQIILDETVRRSSLFRYDAPTLLKAFAPIIPKAFGFLNGTDESIPPPNTAEEDIFVISKPVYLRLGLEGDNGLLRPPEGEPDLGPYWRQPAREIRQIPAGMIPGLEWDLKNYGEYRKRGVLPPRPPVVPLTGAEEAAARERFKDLRVYLLLEPESPESEPERQNIKAPPGGGA